MNSLLAVLFLSTGGLSGDAPLSVEFTGRFALEDRAVDQFGNEFDVIGLSGLVHLGGRRYLAVMDNSDKLVELEIHIDSQGNILDAYIVGGITLREWGDFEGITRTGLGRNSVFLCEETGPAVLEFHLSSGIRLATAPIPAVFATAGHVRAGFGFESMAGFPGSGLLYTANEEALTVDGDLSTRTHGTVVRVQQFDRSSGDWVATSQFAYRTEGLHGQAGEGTRSGLCELVTLPDGRLLALERALAISTSGLFHNRIYLIDSTGATDTSQPPFDQGLIGTGYTAATKTELWSSFTALAQNLEGLCLGPRLPGGEYALLGIIDSGDPLSLNMLASWRLAGDCGGEPCRDWLTLTAPASVQAGGAAVLHVTNADRKRAVTFLYADSLGGSSISGVTLDLGKPIHPLRTVLADAFGRATWTSYPVPVDYLGHTLFFEACSPSAGGVVESNAVPVLVR